MGLGSRWRENPAQWRVDMGALRVQSPGLGALQCGAVPARGVRKSTNGRESTTRRRKRRKQEQRKESNSLSLRNAVRTHLSRCVCVRLCVIVYVFVTFYAFISLSLSPSLPLSLSPSLTRRAAEGVPGVLEDVRLSAGTGQCARCSASAARVLQYAHPPTQKRRPGWRWSWSRSSCTATAVHCR